MTQNTTDHNTKIVTQAEFLETLYQLLSERLYLELRCIHPETGKVRALWSQIGDERQYQSVVRQAEKLNSEGYGVYYAPCLRRTKQGKAEAAALVPALWVDIDCDNDQVKREVGLAALNGFVLQPSAIVDSGGGWHAYWLLNAPFTMQSEDDRQRIAGILHGLFSSLDGDPGYVKSVASVMRLPGSVNTKPGRNNAPVQIIEWQPENRYPLGDFDWLDVTLPKPERIGKLEIITLNGNGHHALPPRTESYLTSGAPLEQRNQELFAAACQLRDAGYSQRDAEGELVVRYMADGNGSENPVGREKEACATISSAFSRSARAPITASKEHARQVVNQLVEQYQVEQKPERPTTQQIIEAVEACVHLNPVEWAEERARLKAVCGDGLKIGDIDRLYREQKRALEREGRAASLDTEAYLALDGQMVYRRQTQRGMMQQVIASWQARILERISRLDEDGKRERVTRVEVTGHDHSETLEIPSELFGDANALQRFLAANAGETFTVRAGMLKHLAPAILALSGTYPSRETYRFMGWLERAGRWVYVSPGDCITTEGSLDEPPTVELSSRLRDYGLASCPWTEARDAFDALTAVFPPDILPACITFAMLPIVQRFFPAAAMRPALHLAGTYGSGKSELAALMSSFYGRFDRDGPPAQWGDTINTVEALGYPLLDALYWVDDYKHIYADERTYTRFLQSYSRGMGRGRLTREAKLREERPCRGLILSTGETTIEGEASALSRMLVLEVPPWEHRDPGGGKLLAADALRDKLPGFTAHFAAWVARQVEAGTLEDEIVRHYQQNVEGYRAKLRSLVKGSRASTGRAVGNWAVLVTVYQLLSRFIDEIDGDYLLPPWRDLIRETVEQVREERASEVFLDILGQLLASGEVMLAEDRQNPTEPPPGTTIVGYRDREFIHLLPEVAFRAVNRVQPLRFTTAAIGAQLREDGWLVTNGGDRHLTVRVSVRSTIARMWRLKVSVFEA